MSVYIHEFSGITTYFAIGPDEAAAIVQRLYPRLYEWLCTYCEQWEIDVEALELTLSCFYMASIIIRFFDRREAALFILFEPGLTDS